MRFGVAKVNTPPKRFWVLGFGFWVLGFGFWVLGFGFCGFVVLGFEVPLGSGG
jgi:hypothetical protein